MDHFHRHSLYGYTALPGCVYQSDNVAGAAGADELHGPGTFEFVRDVYTQGDMLRILANPGDGGKE